MTRQPEDAPARALALDPTQSFAVSAPAGSGKTGLLTHRVLKLLQQVESPEQVLAITFTNKAASEMQDRILAALHTAHGPEPSSDHEKAIWQSARRLLEHDKTHNWQLLKNPSRLRVQTIDGLCRSIASQLPLHSSLGAIPDTVADPQPLYREAATRMLDTLDEATDSARALQVLSRHLDNRLDKLADLFVNLLAKREQWLAYMFAVSDDSARDYLEHCLQQIIDEHLARARRALAPVASELALLLDGAGQYLAEENPDHPLAALAGIAELPPADWRELAKWQLLTQTLLTTQNVFRKSLNVSQGVPPGAAGKAQKARYKAILETLDGDRENAVQALADVRTLPPPHYQEGEWEILRCLTEVLPRLAAELWVSFARSGATDFTAIALAALEALGEGDRPSELALQLDYHIRHILVDEFQDTSLPQLQLLEKLTAGWEAGDGRTLFIVGDGMQSCYGFRNANVGLFLQARRQGIGSVALTPLDLTVNFRSRAGVVDWVNSTFSRAFPQEDDISRGAVRYSPSSAFKPGDVEQPAVRLLMNYYDDEQLDKTDARASEARGVVELIEQRLLEDRDADVAVLARSRRNLEEIVGELNRKGLAYQAQDMDSLASRMAIVDLLTLTRALLQPENRIAWLSLLRTPWLGLDWFDIYALTEAAEEPEPLGDAGGFAFVWQRLLDDHTHRTLSAGGRANCQRAAPALREALEHSARKDLRQWVYGTWLALGGPAALLNETDRADAEQFFELLGQHEQSGTIGDWQAFQQALERLYAVPAGATNTRVQLMTLHKSKGLEFDTVIIPGMDRSSANDSKELLLWRERLSTEGQTQLILGPVAPEGQDHGRLYQYLRSEQQRQNAFETTRLLYVGCTRAIKKLYLCGCAKVNDSSALSAPSPEDVKPAGLLRSLWPQIGEQAAPMPAAPSHLSPSAPSGDTPSVIRRLRSDWQPPTLADNPRLQHLRGREIASQDSSNIPERESGESHLLRLAGTVTHRVLEHLAQHPLPADTDRYLLENRAGWASQLRREGLADTNLTLTLDWMQQWLGQCLNSPQGRWLLDTTHGQSAVEVAYVSAEGGAYRRHVIDRTFVYQGERWIVDYKTSAPPGDLAPAAFIEQLKLAYEPQLARYRALFAGEEHPIRTALYCPALPAELAFIEI